MGGTREARDGRGVTLNDLYNPHLIKNAKSLRKAMTKEERKLWYTFLRYLPVKFVRQKVIGNYIADFYCPSQKMVLELDGSQHYEEAQERYDTERTEFLRGQGIIVMRISNYEIAKDYEGVKKAILYNLHLE